MTRRVLILGSACLLPLIAAAARAADYSADRFDSHVVVLPGGTLQVTETLVLRFEARLTRQVVREISARHTDGIEVVGATMDGAAFPPGSGPGAVEITGRGPVRVRWRFQPVSSSSHTFELTYRVRGAARQDDDADVVAWAALPREHQYRIGSATIDVDIDLPARPATAVSVEAHRTDAPSVEAEDTHIRIRARGLRANAWLEPSIRMPRGTVLDGPPAWQQGDLRAEAAAPGWAAAAGIVAVAGFILLFAIRQSYDAPPRDGPVSTQVPAAPDALPPAIAGALITNGRARLEHAMATLFALADRAELAITEGPRSLGQRTFAVSRMRSDRTLAGHEQRAVDIIFGNGDRSHPVSLPKARARLARRLGTFAKAVNAEMAGAGLIDEGRQAIRNQYQRVAAIAPLTGVASALGLAALVNEYRGWPMLIPAAFVIVGLTALICYAAHTPLSNDALRRGREWRGFQKYLRQAARDRTHAPDQEAGRLLPFAVAAGLAPAWSKHLKLHHANVPPWFHGASADDSAEGFAAFVAVGGAGMAHKG